MAMRAPRGTVKETSRKISSGPKDLDRLEAERIDIYPVSQFDVAFMLQQSQALILPYA
jgi:hypothetical protein